MQLPEYPRYEEYADSGFDWIRSVPSHWTVSKLGSCLTPVSKKNHGDKPLLSITREAGVIERDVEDQDSNHNFIPDDLSNYKLVRKGQFAMNKMKAWQGSYGVSKHTGIVSPAYYVFDFAKPFDPRFFNIAIRSKLYVSYFGSASDGVRIGQWDLNKMRMKAIPFLVPPLEEQQAIARFLDDKTDKIDRAVEIKEGQIALLRERKQIIIQEAVTKGLNPDAPMKDSGIDWIGQIPAHWEVEKLFGLCRFVRGNSAFSKDELLDDGDYVALQYGKTYKVDAIDSSYGFYVNEEFYKRSQVVNFGDTIIISTSETIEDLGHSAVYNRDDVGLLGGEQILIKPISDLMDHLYTFYSTRAFLKELKKCATGVKVFRFNISDLKTIYTAVPPKDEQAAIASRIRGEMGKVDRAIELKERQIEALKEYKATLINAAVTGKIKVI